MGWYRCIKRTNDTRHITNIFYVDVFSIIATKVVYNLLISEFKSKYMTLFFLTCLKLS